MAASPRGRPCTRCDTPTRCCTRAADLDYSAAPDAAGAVVSVTAIVDDKAMIAIGQLEPICQLVIVDGRLRGAGDHQLTNPEAIAPNS